MVFDAIPIKKTYHEKHIIKNLSSNYRNISLSEERRLIAKAKRGSRKCSNEIVLRHMGFVVFRLHKRGFPEFVRRYGEDLLSESIPILYRHIKSYDLEYKDSGGQPKPVKFASYIWKRIDGFIIDSLRKEMLRENSHSALHIEF